MKCPECGNCDAYMGFASIDCPNSACRFYQGGPSAPSTEPAPSNPGRQTTSPSAAATPAPSQGSTGTATIANPGLRVDIISKTRKKSSVEITFTAFGDPGRPNKTVEFLWSLTNQQNQNQKVICTLSSRNTYYVAGIDADGQTVYTTQWRCTLDGVQPNDPWQLAAQISQKGIMLIAEHKNGTQVRLSGHHILLFVPEQELYSSIRTEHFENGRSFTIAKSEFFHGYLGVGPTRHTAKQDLHQVLNRVLGEMVSGGSFLDYLNDSRFLLQRLLPSPELKNKDVLVLVQDSLIHKEINAKADL